MLIFRKKLHTAGFLLLLHQASAVTALQCSSSLPRTPPCASFFQPWSYPMNSKGQRYHSFDTMNLSQQFSWLFVRCHPQRLLRAAARGDEIVAAAADEGLITYQKMLNRILLELDVTPPWGNSPPDCSLRSCHFVMNQLMESNSLDAGPRSEAILRYMLQVPQRLSLKPDDVSLNTVLASYTKSVTVVTSQTGKKRLAEQAYELFKEWKSLHRSNLVLKDLDRISFNTMIAIFSKAKDPKGAEQVFKSLEDCYQRSGDQAYRPDIVSYSSLLHAFASTGDCQRVLSIFEYLQMKGPPPPIHCYNDVLYAFCNSGQPERAWEFLQQWMSKIEISSGDGTVQPDIQSFNIVLNSFLQPPVSRQSLAKAQDLFQSMPVRDKISFATLIGALCRSPENIRNRVMPLVEQAYDDPAIQVDNAFVANVVYSLANCDSPRFAEELVQQLKDRSITPDISLWNALLHCWAKSTDREAGKRCLEILSQLEEDDRLSPNVKTYTNVLDALKARGSEAIDAAEAILLKMESSGPAPTTQSYTALIQIYARSRTSNKAIQAANILQKMKQSPESQPNIVTYNAVLNACEYTNPNDRAVTEEALKVAFVTFDAIRSAPVRPNHVTYGSFLGVLANLMPAGSRQQIVDLVFRRCCQEGQVSKLVLKKLVEAVDTLEQYKRLLKGHSEEELPSDWTCNVREAKARHEA